MKSPNLPYTCHGFPVCLHVNSEYHGTFGESIYTYTTLLYLIIN